VDSARRAADTIRELLSAYFNSRVVRSMNYDVLTDRVLELYCMLSGDQAAACAEERSVRNGKDSHFSHDCHETPSICSSNTFMREYPINYRRYFYKVTSLKTLPF